MSLQEASEDRAAIRAEFRVAAQAAAFHTDDRDIVHSFLTSPSGWLGADWDLADLLDLIDEAELVEWRKYMRNHDLHIMTNSHEASFRGRCRLDYAFDVPMPVQP